MVEIKERKFNQGASASLDQEILTGVEGDVVGIGMAISETAGFGSILVRRVNGTADFDVTVLESPAKVTEYDVDLFPFEVGEAEGVGEYSEKFDTLAGRTYVVLIEGEAADPIDVEITLLVAK